MCFVVSVCLAFYLSFFFFFLFLICCCDIVCYFLMVVFWVVVVCVVCVLFGGGGGWGCGVQSNQRSLFSQYVSDNPEVTNVCFSGCQISK